MSGKAKDRKATRVPRTSHSRAAEPAEAPLALHGSNGSFADADPINLILTQWQRERPDLDPAPMKLFGLLARTHFLSTSYFNHVLSKWHISRGSFDVLATLRRSGPPFRLTPKQLSQSLMLSAAGMTSRLDRLESLHLISRQPDPEDRRSLQIQLTQQGVRLIDEIVPHIVAAQWKIAADLGAGTTRNTIEMLNAFALALTPTDKT